MAAGVLRKHPFSFYGPNDHGVEYVHVCKNSKPVSIHITRYDMHRWNLYDSQVIFVPAKNTTFPSFVNQPDHWVNVIFCQCNIFPLPGCEQDEKPFQDKLCLETWHEVRLNHGPRDRGPRSFDSTF